jgi:hypothetical protein
MDLRRVRAGYGRVDITAGMARAMCGHLDTMQLRRGVVHDGYPMGTIAAAAGTTIVAGIGDKPCMRARRQVIADALHLGFKFPNAHLP